MARMYYDEDANLDLLAEKLLLLLAMAPKVMLML